MWKKYHKKITVVLTVVLTIGILQFVFPKTASASCGNGFSYCRTITIDHTKVPNTDQTSFPIEICANSTPGTGSCSTVAGLNQTGGGAHVQNSNGYDIIFTTDSGCTTKVTAWEMEKYVASTGEMIAWVNDGTLSHTVDTTFYMCYGNASISTFQSTASSVWDTNYKGVWHLPNGTALSLTDSTGISPSPVNHGATASAGQVDGAATFGGTNNYISTANTTTLNTRTFNWTVSAWIKSGLSSGNSPVIIGNGFAAGGNNGCWVVYADGTSGTISIGLVENNGTSLFTDIGSTNVLTNTWQYITVSLVRSSIATLYINGVQNATTSISTVFITGNDYNNSGPTRIGEYGNAANNDGNGAGNVWNGSLDEIQVSSTNRSADWTTTEYNNQSSPSTFETFGSELTGGTTPPHAQAILLKSQAIINKSQTIIN